MVGNFFLRLRSCPNPISESNPPILECTSDRQIKADKCSKSATNDLVKGKSLRTNFQGKGGLQPEQMLSEPNEWKAKKGVMPKDD